MYTLRPAHFLSPFVYSLSHVSIPSSNRVSFFHHCAFKIIPRSIYFNRANKIQKYFSSYVLAQESFFFDPGKDNHRSFSSSYVAFNVPPWLLLSLFLLSPRLVPLIHQNDILNIVVRQF